MDMMVIISMISRNNFTGEDKKAKEIFEEYKDYGTLSYSNVMNSQKVMFVTDVINGLDLLEDLVTLTVKNIHIKRF